jgi:hypothetical protein
MRTLILTFGVLIIATQVQTRALEFDVFSINKPSVPPTALVSFAIGYPKGWGVTQDPMQQQQDIYFDVVTRDPGPWICTFWPTNVSPTNFANFTIWRSYGATAKDAANQFAENSRKITMLALVSCNTTSFALLSCGLRAFLEHGQPI